MVTQNSINLTPTPLNLDAFGNLSQTYPFPIIQLQFPYGLNARLTTATATGSGTVTHSVPFAVCSTTATTSSSASLQSIDNLHYGSGQGGLCLFTAIFTTGVEGNVQEVGLGGLVDGLFFGYNGTSFGINRRTISVDNYTPQTSWNGDRMDGTGSSGVTLDPAKGNVYKIQYQWLGFGAINFYIEDQNTGAFVLVHQIKYSNLNTETSILNPSMPVRLSSANTTNNTNVVVKVPSLAAYIEGIPQDIGISNSISNNKTTITTETNILTIKSNTTFNSIVNRKVVLPVLISLSNTSNSDSFFRLVLNTTLGGSPAYTNINATESCVSYDVAGTTVTGGSTLAVFACQGNRQIEMNIKDLSFNLAAGDTLTFSALSTGAGIAASTAVTWSERF